MSLFVVLAASLTALALGWLLWPLLRTRAAHGVDRQHANRGVLRDQLNELEAEYASGAVAEGDYALMRSDLERRVLEETQTAATAPSTRVPPSATRSRRVAAVLAVSMPLAAGLIYWQFGDRQAFEPLLATAADQNPHALQPEQIAKMVRALEDRLQREPDNVNGWVTLARTYSSQQRFADAARAYATLVERIPDDADLLADYADALAMAEGRRIGAGPLALVKKALAIDPSQWKALAMAGTEAFERKDYKAAVGYWERLQRSLPADAPMARSIGASIAEARQLGGLNSAPKANSPGAASARISGTVSLSPALKARVAPQDRVFVFARAPDGRHVPLALMTAQVRDLPLAFALDDSMAMSPEFRLSAYPRVVVGARVSKSGQAAATSGDLEGLTPSIALGANNVTITIDTVVP